MQGSSSPAAALDCRAARQGKRLRKGSGVATLSVKGATAATGVVKLLSATNMMSSHCQGREAGKTPEARCSAGGVCGVLRDCIWFMAPLQSPGCIEN